MRKLKKSCSGAVTVFVTLLLIPAILVSGTAVDLARVYTAKSILQDANQLAANSILASYDALTQDIYGLYGVMEDDPVMGDLLDKYIRVAVFGESEPKGGLGTFQLFYGSDLQDPTVTKAQSLGNIKVLRRQIEEYSKFRAPVIIVNEIMDAVDQFKDIKKDSEIISDKLELEDKVEEIKKIYQELYDLIQDANGYVKDEDGVKREIDAGFENIYDELRALKSTREEYEDLYRESSNPDPDEADDCRRHFDGILDNIEVLVDGGTLYSNWERGRYDENGEWIDGSWRNHETVQRGLEKAAKEGKKKLSGYSDKLDKLVSKAQQADKKKSELKTLIDNLEANLNSGNCSEEMKSSISSDIEQYKKLLKYDIGDMAIAMRGENAPIIEEMQKELDELTYGKTDTSLGVSLNNLSNLSGNSGYSIDLNIVNNTLRTGANDELSQILSVGIPRLAVKGSYKPFNDSSFSSTKNPEFYSELQRLLSEETGNSDSEKKRLRDALKNIQSTFKGMVDYTTEGADYYRATSGDAGSSFVDEGDWGSEDSARDSTKDALNDSIIKKIGNILDDAANKLLILTYDTEMFSNFTTTSDPVVKTMSGIPMSTDVNYFFQSEQEYLFNGNEGSAKSNLIAVSGMIMLVRFVFNYIATFTVQSVKTEIMTIKASTGPFGVLIGELARLAYALGESVLDVGDLRSGGDVVIMKTDETWRFSLTGLVSSAVETVSGVDTGGRPSMTYSEYLRIFLLFKDGDTLAERTKKLISLNITNKKQGINANEELMSGATLFDLNKAMTDFSIASTVNLRFLFLSMPFAQKGLNGVVPAKTAPIEVTDYRGY